MNIYTVICLCFRVNKTLVHHKATHFNSMSYCLFYAFIRTFYMAKAHINMARELITDVKQTVDERENIIYKIYWAVIYAKKKKKKKNCFYA